MNVCENTQTKTIISNKDARLCHFRSTFVRSFVRILPQYLMIGLDCNLLKKLKLFTDVYQYMRCNFKLFDFFFVPKISDGQLFSLNLSLVTDMSSSGSRLNESKLKINKRHHNIFKSSIVHRSSSIVHPIFQLCIAVRMYKLHRFCTCLC